MTESSSSFTTSASRPCSTSWRSKRGDGMTLGKSDDKKIKRKKVSGWWNEMETTTVADGKYGRGSVGEGMNLLYFYYKSRKHGGGVMFNGQVSMNHHINVEGISGGERMTCSTTTRNNDRTAWKKSTQVAEWLFYLQQQHPTTTKPKMSIEVEKWLEINSSSKQLALRQLGKISMEVDSKDMIVNQNNSKNTERNGRWKPDPRRRFFRDSTRRDSKAHYAHTHYETHTINREKVWWNRRRRKKKMAQISSQSEDYDSYVNELEVKECRTLGENVYFDAHRIFLFAVLRGKSHCRSVLSW